MISRTSFADAVRLIRFAAILWIGYLTALALINQSFGDPQRGNVEVLYYVLLGLVALLCLGLAYWPWIQGHLGRAFIPVIIAIITVGPIIITWLVISVSHRNPALSPDSSVLRLLPFLIVGFLLVAWQYRWQYIILVIFTVAGLNIGIIWSFPAPGPEPIRGALTVTLVQTIVFLAAGFAISYIVNRLRRQQLSLEEANVRLTHYASTLEHLATSRERNRVARELHDTLAHTLSALSVQLEGVKVYWDVDQQTARSTLEKSLTAARSGLEETRRALQALRASPLDDLGLALAVQTMVEDTAERANLALNLSITDNLPPLSPDVEQCVYRVAQEAATNVANHAKAKNMTMNLEFIEGKVTLIVRDDGVGFNVEKNDKTSHFGLKGMRERAELVGGELTINSKSGEGTTIKLIV